MNHRDDPMTYRNEMSDNNWLAMCDRRCIAGAFTGVALCVAF